SLMDLLLFCVFFFFQAEDGIRDRTVTGVQTCALPISSLTSTRSHRTALGHPRGTGRGQRRRPARVDETLDVAAGRSRTGTPRPRSEERRVGKEWRSGGWTEP